MSASGKKSVAWGMIGGGNMGRAIAHAAIAGNGTTEHNVCIVAEKDPATRERLECLTCLTAGEAMEWLRAHDRPGEEPGVLVLCVKPQSLGEVAREIRPAFDDTGRVVVSVLAGTPGAKVRAALGSGARVVRAMPNLPASVGQGCTAVCLSAGAYAGDEDFAVELFQGVGPSVIRIPEELMDAFTAVVGSGPAYCFYLAEAMIRGAMRVGFDEKAASAIVRQTLFGSAEMLRRDLREPEALRAAVTSKGGTTGAATAVLDAGAVQECLVNAIIAARDRGVQLARL